MWKMEIEIASGLYYTYVNSHLNVYFYFYFFFNDLNQYWIPFRTLRMVQINQCHLFIMTIAEINAWNALSLWNPTDKMFGTFAKYFALIFHVKCHRFSLLIPSVHFESNGNSFGTHIRNFLILIFRKIFWNICSPMVLFLIIHRLVMNWKWFEWNCSSFEHFASREDERCWKINIKFESSYMFVCKTWSNWICNKYTIKFYFYHSMLLISFLLLPIQVVCVWGKI